MKSITILTSIFLLVCVVSCKKDSKTTSNGSTHYVKFKFNGTQKQYTVYTTSLLGTPSSADGCEIIGYAGGTHPAGVTITVVDSAPITTNKTYTEVMGIVTYVDESGISYAAGSIYNNTSFKLVITEIASDHIKGTFSAVLQKEGTPIEFITVTDGVFYVGRSS